MKLNLSRRAFIKWLSAISGVVVAKMAGLVPEVQAAPPTGRFRQEGSGGNKTGVGTIRANPEVIEGELYEGFLLLPEGAPVPATVMQSKLGIPIVCGVGVGRGGPEPTAIVESVSSAIDLPNKTQFPIYTFSKLPSQIRSASATLIRHSSGEVFTSSVDFQTYNKNNGVWETTISIWAQPDFPRPLPLWSSTPAELGGPAVVLEKVDFLPSPGIRVTTDNGYVFHWIENDIFYTFVAENILAREEATKLIGLLTRIE